MAEDFEQIGSFLSRWSRRKLEKTGAAPAQPQAEAAATPDVPAGPPAGTGTEPAAETTAEGGAEPLPSVESLTPASDFTPFMQSTVDPGVKTAALKQLFKDPHFNVMDGLDTYIEDYSIPDPIPDAMMKTLYQARQHVFSDEEKAQADADDAARAAEEEKALADAADALDAGRESAAADLERELDAFEARDAQLRADSAAEALRADPPVPDKKDA